MGRYMQVAVLLAALCAVGVLTAEVGVVAADAESVAAPRVADAAATKEAEDADHVRDKRRLPEPGFVIPATPMGFSKNGQPAQQVLPQGLRPDRSPTSAPTASTTTTASQAERKASSASLRASPSPSPASRGSFSYADSLTRHKKAPGVPKPVPGSREAPLGREEHVRALTSFLQQTRKLGVPDEQALKLLDKELAKAKRQGPAYRPVYHATPLKPYGALINFNQAPYEKHQLKNMKPIKEQQNDIPPPNKPIVVESDRQILGAKATPSPAAVPGQHTEALVAAHGPLPVSVPRPIEPLHLTSPKLSPLAVPHSSPQPLAVPHSSPQPLALPHPSPQPLVTPYQTVALPYKQEETFQTLQTLDHSQYLQATPMTIDSETPVSLEAMHSYPVPEQHSYPVPEQHSYPVPEQHSFPEQHIISAPVEHAQHAPLLSTVAAPHVAVEEVRQPVYVYRQEEVKLPQPQLHVELPPAPVVVAKQQQQHVVVHGDQEGGLYHDHKEHPEEYASQYRFGYRVRDQHAGNDFGHAETRDGKMTKGEYFVSLPDGRLQSVKYWADQGGYHAQISYTSQATHPAGPAH